MQPGDCLWHLLAVYCSGEASAEELNELNNIAQNNPAVILIMQTFYHFWQSKSATDTAAINEAWKEHVKRIAQS